MSGRPQAMPETTAQLLLASGARKSTDGKESQCSWSPSACHCKAATQQPPQTSPPTTARHAADNARQMYRQDQLAGASHSTTAARSALHASKLFN